MPKLSDLRDQFKAARAAWREDKQDKSLRKAYRAAKREYEEFKADKPDPSAGTAPSVSKLEQSTPSIEPVEAARPSEPAVQEKAKKRPPRKPRKRRRKRPAGVFEQDVSLTPVEKLRRAVQAAARKRALELQADKSLDKKERKKLLQRYVIDERRRRKAEMMGYDVNGRLTGATSWRKRTFAERDSRFIDDATRAEKRAKYEKAAEKGKKHDVVIIPIFWKHEGDQRERVLAAAAATKARMIEKSRLNVWIDSRTRYTPGEKFSYWEHLGVRVRVEIGPKDIATDTCALTLSSTPGQVGAKLGTYSIKGRCKALLQKIAQVRQDQLGLKPNPVPSDDEDGGRFDEVEAATTGPRRGSLRAAAARQNRIIKFD